MYRTATLGQRVHSSDEDISEEVHHININLCPCKVLIDSGSTV